MFDDPKKYFRTFTNTVNTCALIGDFTLEGPNVSRSWEHWQVITVELQCSFHSGERLEVFEGYTRKNLKQSILRNLSYQFMQPDGSTIFRIDTHGADTDKPCHLHIDAEEARVLDGDRRLNGFSLANISFLSVFPIVFGRLEGRPFPWEQQL